MLLSNSKCTSCKNKNFCKHYDYLCKSFDINVDIKECDNYISDMKLRSWSKGTAIQSDSIRHGVLKTPNTIITTPKLESLTVPDKDVLRFRDINNSSLTNITSTPVEVKKVKCERCGKEVIETEAQVCDKCGKLTCYECGSVLIDLDSNKPILTCYDCIPENIANEPAMEWNIDNFTVKEEEEVEQPKKTTKRTSRKSKKQ